MTNNCINSGIHLTTLFKLSAHSSSCVFMHTLHRCTTTVSACQIQEIVQSAMNQRCSTCCFCFVLQVASEAVLTDLFSQDCTFQVHQPQRIHDNLWRLLAALEAHLGCLVGSNSYITAPKSQGLAPHHDDVEIFVCQTSGGKVCLLPQHEPRIEHRLL